MARPSYVGSAPPAYIPTGAIGSYQAAKLIKALETVRDSSINKATQWNGSDESKAQEYRTQARAYAAALAGIALAQRGELT